MVRATSKPHAGAKPNTRRTFLTGLMIATALTAVVPVASHADPVACATVYYTWNTNTPHYIVNDCYVPSPWAPVAGDGPGCDSVSGTPNVSVCHNFSFSFPVP